MKAVGVRELKDHLSRYLEEVRLGDEVLITDRGEVIASLGPPTRERRDASLPPGLLELARAGIVTLGDRRPAEALPLFEGTATAGLAAQLLADERGER